MRRPGVQLRCRRATGSSPLGFPVHDVEGLADGEGDGVAELGAVRGGDGADDALLDVVGEGGERGSAAVIYAGQEGPRLAASEEAHELHMPAPAASGGEAEARGWEQSLLPRSAVVFLFFFFCCRKGFKPCMVLYIYLPALRPCIYIIIMITNYHR
jgi:hypothetical protein